MKEFTMAVFEKIKSDNNLKEVIKSAFDAELSVSGGWGYDRESATIIEKSDQPISQMEHLIASMRTYLEMSMTQQKEERYGGINLNEIAREEYRSDSNLYHKVNYAITAMKEDRYNIFIEEYKEGYGKANFDLSGHFKRRKKATLERTESYWFRIDSSS